METNTQDCPRCHRTLPLEAYSPSQRGTKGRWCRQCNAESRLQKRREGNPRVATHCGFCGKELTGRPQQKFCDNLCNASSWRRDHPKAQRGYHLKNAYGISESQYKQMLDEQGGACLICLRSFLDDVRPVVDHDHEDGRVRGLLCDDCNKGLGYFRDQVAYLQRAIEYLATPTI